MAPIEEDAGVLTAFGQGRTGDGVGAGGHTTIVPGDFTDPSDLRTPPLHGLRMMVHI
jgi:hypothetical protein